MWYNENDVFNDLAVFSGGYIPQHLDSSCLVFGENPPPRRPDTIEEDELILLYGSNGYQKNPNYIQTVEPGPDIAGIKEMLKVVKETEYDSDEDIIVPATNKTVIISKLNPNVTPFTPKAVNRENVQQMETATVKKEDAFVKKDENAIVKNDEDGIVSEKENAFVKKELNANVERDVKRGHFKKEKCDTLQKEINTYVNENATLKKEATGAIKKDKQTESSNNVEEEVISRKVVEEKSTDKLNVNENGITSVHTEVAKELINKISLAGRSNSYEVKRAKNLAMSSLLKMYTREPSSNAVAYKLKTPNDFISKDKVSKDCKDNYSNPDIVKTVETVPDLNPPTISNGVDKYTSSSSSDNELISIKNESIKDDIPVATNFMASVESDPEVENSIKKVTSWLNGSSSGNSTPTKRPVAYYSPTEMFKKKDIKPSTPEPKEKDTKYEPSKYAEELVQMYKERQKTQETKYDRVTWNNLEDVLKQKDIAIKLAKKSKKGKGSPSSQGNGDGDHN